MIILSAAGPLRNWGDWRVHGQVRKVWSLRVWSYMATVVTTTTVRLMGPAEDLGPVSWRSTTVK